MQPARSKLSPPPLLSVGLLSLPCASARANRKTCLYCILLIVNKKQKRKKKRHLCSPGPGRRHGNPDLGHPRPALAARQRGRLAAVRAALRCAVLHYAVLCCAALRCDMLWLCCDAPSLVCARVRCVLRASSLPACSLGAAAGRSASQGRCRRSRAGSCWRRQPRQRFLCTHFHALRCSAPTPHRRVTGSLDAPVVAGRATFSRATIDCPLLRRARRAPPCPLP